MREANNPTRPKFTLEFKQDAARLVIDKGCALPQAAASLGVSVSALRRWVKAGRGGGRKAVPSPAGQQELARLRKESERLRMERDILKKAAAFFAKELG